MTARVKEEAYGMLLSETSARQQRRKSISLSSVETGDVDGSDVVAGRPEDDPEAVFSGRTCPFTGWWPLIFAADGAPRIETSSLPLL